MLNLKDNSNLVLQAFQKFLGSRDSNDFLIQTGIWIVGYVTRKLRASEDEASLVFLKFWIDRAKLIEYFNSKGFKNLFGFLACFSKNLLLNVRRKEQYSKTKEDFVLSNEQKKLNIQKNANYTVSSKTKLRTSLKKISILNRIILCLRYGIKLSREERIFLFHFLNNETIYKKLIHEFEKRIKERKDRELEKIEKLNFYQWKLSYQEKNSEHKTLSRKRKLQNEILQLEAIFTFKELSNYLGISNYKIVQSCDYSLKFIAQDLSEK